MTVRGTLSCSGVSTGISGYDVPSATRPSMITSGVITGTSSKCSGKIARPISYLTDGNIFWQRRARRKRFDTHGGYFSLTYSMLLPMAVMIMMKMAPRA